MTTSRNLLFFGVLAMLALPGVASAQESVPWYEPNASVDQAVAEPQPPPKVVGRPPDRAFAVEIGPLGYLGSEASGIGSFLKLKYTFDKSVGLIGGFLLPGGIFGTGLEINPLGGLLLADVDEMISLWLLGPRTTLLALLGTGSPTGVGIGGQFAPIGGRLSVCTPTCFFADLRILEFSGLLYAIPSSEQAFFLKSLGGNLSVGAAF